MKDAIYIVEQEILHNIPTQAECLLIGFMCVKQAEAISTWIGKYLKLVN